jgi:transcriptional regulator with XRE-family HTH domain/tetratricopeptide (TPR) repeat protein
MKDKALQRLGQRIRLARKSRGWTQRELARYLNPKMPENQLEAFIRTISRWENGKNRPYPYHLRLLAQVFETSEEELFGESSQDGQECIFEVPALNPYFSGRYAVLAKMREALSPGIMAKLALIGMPGIGKTQTAIAYAHIYQAHYQFVAFIRAGQRDTLLDDYVKFAHLAGLITPSEYSDGNRELCARLFLQWLQNRTNWLLIFDNAEDERLIQQYMPVIGSGHMILTAHTSLYSVTTILQLVELTEKESIAFLRRRMRIENLLESNPLPAIQNKLLTPIAKVLDGWPLALETIGAMLYERVFTHEEIFAKLLQYPSVLFQRHYPGHTDYPYSLVNSIVIAWERLANEDPLASKLLIVCSLLCRKSISGQLLLEIAPLLSQQFATRAGYPIAWRKLLLTTTYRFSLLTYDQEWQTLTIHRLTQSIILDHIEISARLKWTHRLIYALATIFSRGFESGQLHSCESYLPHVLHLSQIIATERIRTLDAISLLFRAGECCNLRGQFSQAASLLHQALAIDTSIPDDAHALWWSLHVQYAITCLLQGALENARLSLLVLIDDSRIQETKLLLPLSYLGRIFVWQGYYAEALPIWQHAYRIAYRFLPADHPDLARALEDLGILYIRLFELRSQAKEWENAKYNLQMAKDYLIQARMIWETRYGARHPDVASVLSDLSYVYFYLGDFTKAASYALESLAQREEMIPDHYSIAYNHTILGWIAHVTGYLDDAELSFRRALIICETKLGMEHFETSAHMYFLGEFLVQQQRYAEAEPLLTCALAIAEQHLGYEAELTRAIYQKRQELK